MPIKRPILANDEIYHVVVRGVDGRNIFLNESDYWRGIRGLYEFNDFNPVNWSFRRKQQFENSSRTVWVKERREKPRDRLIDLLCFCLMPNHIHLLLKQIKDDGISKFMRKFGAGYVGYFNNKNQRQGHLFQGRFKAIHIKTDEHLKTSFVYVHTNPAFLVDKGWKGDGIKEPKAIIKKVESYKWSSYQDYLGNKNFPSLTQRDLFNKIMEPDDWRKFVNDWIKSKTIDDFSDVALE